MAFPPAFLDEIRNRVSLVVVIGRRTRLVRKGREHTGLCPFHNEKTPSFTVNEDKGFYHCFGCGAHGDVIGFTMRADSLSFPEAIERLAGEAGLEVPQSSPEEREQAKRQASLLDAVEAACAFFEKELRSARGRIGLDYLRGRGLDDETIARFRLGYAPDTRGALWKALQAAQIPLPLAQEAGLLTVSEHGGDPFDRFHGRVIFPISDRRGRIVAFGGRILGEGQPKYLNSADSSLFHKGEMLYGVAQARAGISEQGTAIVCEGYMDVIALHRAGFTQAVAPLGTALTERQIELLWRMTPEPIICLDGDTAGRRAATRAAERALPMLKPGFSLRFAMVPPPEDPDSLIKASGPQAMRKVLDDAKPMSEIVWQAALAQYPSDTPERRAALEKALMEGAASIADGRVKEEYRRFFKDKLRETFAPVWRPPAPGARRKQGNRPGTSGMVGRGFDGRLPGIGRPAEPHHALLARERMLLLPLIVHPPLIETVSERLGGLHFLDSGLDGLRQALLNTHDSVQGLDSAALQDYLRATGFAQVLESLLAACNQETWAVSAKAEIADKAAAVWADALRMFELTALEEDIHQAEARFAADPSEGNWARLMGLKQEQASAQRPELLGDADL
ncbi:MAG TPA: DNA primase [Magnetospirillaceae bacterium]|jgi:DNA primase